MHEMKNEKVSMAEDVSCPFCKVKTGQIIRNITAEQSASYFVLEKNDFVRYNGLRKHIASLWGQENCKVIHCDACGGSYAWPFISGDKLFYDLAFPSHRYPRNKWEYSRAISLIKERINKQDLCKLNILEIGAGDGAFVKKLIDIGVPSKNIGVFEFNDPNRIKLNKMGLKYVSADDYLSTLNSTGKYNIIFLFQVLEHLSDLDKTLDVLSSNLFDDGYIIIGVPNYDYSNFIEKQHGYVIDMPPVHVSGFSRKSVDQLAARHKLIVEHFETKSNNDLSDIIFYFYFQYRENCQKENSLASFVSGLPANIFRKLIMMLYLFLLLMVNLKILPLLIKNRNTTNLILMKKNPVLIKENLK